VVVAVVGGAGVIYLLQWGYNKIKWGNPKKVKTL